MQIGDQSWLSARPQRPANCEPIRVHVTLLLAMTVSTLALGGTGNRADNHDYDVEHYARLLRATFAVRLERAFTPTDYAALFADPDQMSLFVPRIEEVQTILTKAVETP